MNANNVAWRLPAWRGVVWAGVVGSLVAWTWAWYVGRGAQVVLRGVGAQPGLVHAAERGQAGDVARRVAAEPVGHCQHAALGPCEQGVLVAGADVADLGAVRDVHPNTVCERHDPPVSRRPGHAGTAATMDRS